MEKKFFENATIVVINLSNLDEVISTSTGVGNNYPGTEEDDKGVL